MSGNVRDNPDEERFELVEDGKLAFAKYRIEGGMLVIPWVEADPALRGRGSAGRLMEGVAAHARERGLKIRPICGYAAAWLKRHPAGQDLIA